MLDGRRKEILNNYDMSLEIFYRMGDIFFRRRLPNICEIEA
jgi:hypothetical protein